MKKYRIWTVTALVLASIFSFPVFSEDDDIDADMPIPAKGKSHAKRHIPENHAPQIALIPMIGGNFYTGRWGDHVKNNYSFGLALDIPLSYSFSMEVEGTYSRYNVSYSSLPVGMPSYSIRHSFDQFSLGSNGKFYFLGDTIFRPYGGAGLMALHYAGMQRNPIERYNTTIGAGQLIAGFDVNLSRSFAIGMRGAWVVPLFNRPITNDSGQFSLPGFEEAAAINTSFLKLSGAVKVSL